MNPRAAVFMPLLLGLVVGCGGSQPAKKPHGEAASDPAAPKVAKDAAGGAPGDKGAGEAAAVKAATAPADRKIVYTATIELIVRDLDEALPQVEKLVAAHKGYISKSEVRNDTGTRRVATFAIRVPVDAFAPTREGLLPLGTPERNALDSQDVTEEYVDVQARIKNLKEQEDKLNELLKEKRKEEKLEDVIKVSDRIAEVRRDVERVQGRLNYLANMTTLATINLTLKEIKDYKPPTAPTFGSRATATFEKSWDTLVEFGQGLALFVVGLGPWLPILIPAGFALVWAVRRYRRSSRDERVSRPVDRGPDGVTPGA